ncbi:hypothetical protein [Sulfurimonas sp.]|uniref:hypothetical protein n=1 Tax=Sulfurimonas sp. TaxID=2022749 RepID=UPI00356B51C9
MASYGSGFAQGMNAGSNMMSNIINTAQRSKLFNQAQQKEKTTNNLFNAYGEKQAQLYNDANYQRDQEWYNNLSDELRVEEDILQQRATQAQEQLKLFSNASPGDMTNLIMQEYKANGGKINDNTYMLANGVANKLFGIKQQAAKLEQDTTLFGLKKQKYEKEINTSQSNIGKQFDDFGIDKTEDNYNKYSGLFSQGKTPTSMTEYKYAVKDHGYKGTYTDFLKFKKQRDNAAPSSIREYDYAVKNQGYKGTYTDFLALKKDPLTASIINEMDDKQEAPKQKPQTKKKTVDDILNNL